MVLRFGNIGGRLRDVCKCVGQERVRPRRIVRLWRDGDTEPRTFHLP